MLATEPIEQTADRASGSLLTKRELAERLRLSTRSVDAWMRSKRLPYIKAGRSVRFVWGDCLEKLNAFRVN